jgi:MSHA pilin protein MshC
MNFGAKKIIQQSVRAFTILEVIAVLIVLGIVSTVAVSHFSGTRDIENRIGMEQIISHLRYVKTHALASGGVWGINFQGTNYVLYRNGNATDTLTAPGAESNPVPMPQGLIYNGYISFDGWGRAYSDESGLIELNGTIPMGEGNLTVFHETGYMQ